MCLPDRRGGVSRPRYGFRAPTAEELADHLLAQSAAQQPRFSDPSRPACQHPGLITPEDLTQLVQLLQQQLMQPAALASYFTQPKDPDALVPHEPRPHPGTI